MSTALEDLFFGDLDVNTTNPAPNTLQAEAWDRYDAQQQALRAALAPEAIPLLNALLNTQSELHGQCALEKFTLGFRVGVQLIVEGMKQ